MAEERCASVKWTSQVFVTASGRDSTRGDLQRAARHFEAGRFEEAAGICHHITRSVPGSSGSWRAWYLLGAACCAMGRVREAEAPLQEALRLKPDFADAHNVLALPIRNE